MTEPTSIKPNQKFSFVALSVNVDGKLPESMPFHQGLWATRKLPVALDEEWKRWIGSIRAERIAEDCNLFLCAAMDSAEPGVLDHENKQLDSAIMRLFDGLMLTGNVNTTATPIMLGGAYQQDGLTVRSIGDLRRPMIPGGVDYDDITADMVALAWRHAMGRINFEKTTTYDRIARVLFIFDNAVITQSVHERLHQFCRCIEGLILPNVGKTEKQFVSRTELFVGPSHHDTMRALYKMRSKVEHMHDYEWPSYPAGGCKCGLACAVCCRWRLNSAMHQSQVVRPSCGLHQLGRLQAMQEVGGTLGVGSGRKDRALVFLQDLDPRCDIGRVIRHHLRRQ